MMIDYSVDTSIGIIQHYYSISSDIDVLMIFIYIPVSLFYWLKLRRVTCPLMSC